MTVWKKVCYFADGVIYACGDRRKVVLPEQLDVYYELKVQESGGRDLRGFVRQVEKPITG